MSEVSFFSYFTDPVLRAPTLGSMFMCLSAGLMGVIVYLRRQSLIGEVLSHACYPGVILALCVAGGLSVTSNDEILFTIILLGASLFSFLALYLIHFLERKIKVASDTALCFVLSTFFGMGVMLVSEIQFSYTSLYKQALTFLYGQAATLTDIHIVIYALFSLVLILFIGVFYKELHISLFDRNYAKSLGVAVILLDSFINLFMVVSIVIGVRSVGVILMSAMLIAPVVAARRLTHHLSSLFVISGLFALLSGFLGNYFSVELTERLLKAFPSSRLILPTGPMIVLSGVVLCVAVFLCAPQRGLLARMKRIFGFRTTVICENVLKELWKKDKTFEKSLFPLDGQRELLLKKIRNKLDVSPLLFRFILRRMIAHGWLTKDYFLTEDGFQKASRIIRLHRLWELYLTSHLGVGHDRVHRSAEEMEHILTPDIERQLTEVLGNPQKDPYSRPIPSGDRWKYV